MLQSQPICISQAKQADKNELMYLLSNHFVELNPFMNYLQITSQEFFLYVEPFVQISLNQALALVAKDNKGCIVGACIALDCVTEINRDAQSTSCSMQNYREFFHQLNSQLKQYFMKKKIKIEPGMVLSGGFLVVAPAFFGMGIPQRLGQAIFSMAKSKGFQFIAAEFIDLCHYNSHKRQLGHSLEVIHTLAYKDFINKRGEQPMQEAYGECILTLVEIAPL